VVATLNPTASPVSAGTAVENLDASAQEAALVIRLADGDRDEPLIDLYGRYASRLYGLGLRLLGDRGLAEELVQETFVRLWRGAGRFDPSRGTVRALLFTIARRVAVDLRRRHRVTVALPDEDVAEEDAFDQVIAGLDFRNALESLSAKHREVLELCYDGDLTQSQIADRLDLPLGTVKTRTFYALKALKLELEERGLV
jgi:RNA polymerase sigma-70 factor (ECF subfamily)